MQISTRRFLILATTALLFPVFSASVSAQRNPTMTEQQRDAEKERYYAKFLDHKRVPTGEQQRLAYEDAQRYLERFGGDNDANARAVQKFVKEYQKFTHEYDIYEAYSARNYAKTFEIGRPILEREPENFYVLGVLTEAGYENAVAGNATLNADTIGYSRKAIQLLDDGKVTKSDPFKSIDLARGFLNSTLGWFLKDQSPVEAAAAFLKAIQSDSPYRTDPLIYHRLGIAILKGEFAQVSAEYNEKYGAKEPSPEQKAMFERVNHLGERAIDAYARAVALSTSPQQQELKTKILAQLTALYKNLHNNSDAGLNELIASVLSKPLPL
jgi:hypothetical protein